MELAFLCICSVCYPGTCRLWHIYDTVFYHFFLSSGWRGDSCSLPRCRDTCDPVGGTCSEPNGCECNLGYSGRNCEIGELYPLSIQLSQTLYNLQTTEGLSIKFLSTSSLATVADYQNATIYLDLSENLAFSSFKVGGIKE